MLLVGIYGFKYQAVCFSITKSVSWTQEAYVPKENILVMTKTLVQNSKINVKSDLYISYELYNMFSVLFPNT